ncbi:AtpZ/AtpI family protein [Desulfovibrio mangrovi]|uniref:AtpZ/AtpI family protein n=1 Tax=Desulfovibrio mangrovi TaxID=2976983 RepID=UPI002246EEE9|nr:AtpZ/AtpI family protein [Desulfovibrio mangrovi]UZP68807.1 AtpZ/AtpI family protein [Desulfovibrio mangrovi]
MSENRNMPETNGKSAKLKRHSGKAKDFPSHVAARERRKLKAGRTKPLGAWYGLGMFGAVGWFVVVPTLIGIFTGVWIDLKWPGPYSWTLMLMVLGLGAGCLGAGVWLNQQRQKVLRERENDDG